VAGATAVGFALAHWPWAIAGAICGGALLLLTMLRPLTVIGLMLFLGPIDLSFVTGGFKTLFPALGGLDMNGLRLIGISASLLALAVVNREMVRHALASHGRWYLAFLVFAAASLLLSPARIDGLRLLLKLAYPFLIFVAVLGLARTREDLEYLGNWVLAGALFISVINPLYVMAGGYYVDMAGRIRVHGVGAHQNPFSFYLLIVLLFSFARYLGRRQYRYLALCGLLGIWLALTRTRITFGAGLLAFTALGLYDAVALRRYGTIARVLAVGGILAMPLLHLMMERTFGYRMGLGELLGLLRDPLRMYQSMSWEGREVIWPVVFAAFLSRPLIGLGLGASTFVLLANFPAEFAGVIHNEYLRLAADTGVVGVSLFGLAVGTWWVLMIRARGAPDPMAREFALPAFGGILAWAVIGATDNAFDYYAAFTQFIAFLCAGTVALWQGLPSRAGFPGAGSGVKDGVGRFS
jgi:O-antigen ligase